ncbi:F-box/WD repeat-containing protein 8-like isoform X2 [Watersipora subatra]|uniref:F-box/WD repeat-containing protein 8-like isoform X2 n=1 Tax=Watersipora subatra TaxID=2589382 RepID=UPI00355B101E
MSGNSSNPTADLKAFRDDWKNELSRQARDAEEVKVEPEAAHQLSPSSTPAYVPQDNSFDEAPFPFQFTDSLLRGWQESPPSLSKQDKRKSVEADPSKNIPVCQKKPRRSLVDVFIDDLNDLDDIPFFDISLPREIAVRIFSFLEINDLCACSQVSAAWSSIANDNLIWERLYQRIQMTFTGQSLISQSDNWKQTVKECYVSSRNLLLNWKEHKCQITYYHHAQGGILTSAHALNDLLIAGYTNGQVRCWNISNQDTQTFEPSNKSLQLLNEDDDGVLGTSENSVTSVKIADGDTVMAGYKHGQVQIWKQADIDSLLVLDFPGYCVKDLVSNMDIGYIQLGHQTNGNCDIKILSLSGDSTEAIASIQIRTEDENWTLPKHLMIPLHVSSSDTTPLMYLSRNSVHVHRTTYDYYTSRFHHSSSPLEEFYATHFTCLESSSRYFNLGFTSHLGLQAEYKVRQYDAATLGNVTDLRGHTSQVTCIDSSFPSGSMLCTGCHDRRVRLYDCRLPSYAVHTYMGHPDAVQCIQSDDWKIVSGDMEGYICAWDQRMANKFWESQSRYRGRLQLSDFSVEHSLTGLPSICSSSYDMPEASTYNLSLITPYDSI